ncbi:hypothetical protein HU200_002497 [Digitaria exilis]|uniref:DUF4220 domain-containing protein n=1 Tax=Digitaria exilis TaxID=1010633 RepID=A0A835FYB0_9POAL|nr:hypothetical protein HU200_002497 [Digitaria exilis]
MGFSEGVQWWEDWQLRFLVLFSLFIQYFLFVAAILRKRRIPHWFRFLIWLAYLGCDAVVIYALATLFNLHKKNEEIAPSSDRALRPRDPQVPAKPWALKNATLTTIMSSPDSRLEETLEKEDMGRKDILSLHKFVENAAKSVQDADAKDKKDAQDSRENTPIADDKKDAQEDSIHTLITNNADDRNGNAKDKKDAQDSRENTPIADDKKDAQEDSMHTLITNNADDRNGKYVQEALLTVRDLKKKVGDKPYHLFADLGHPYFVRLKNLQERGHTWPGVRRLYTKHKRRTLAGLLRTAAVLLPFTVIGLLHESRRNMYNHDDVIVTNVLLCCTAVLELVSTFFFLGCGLPSLDDQIYQYNLMGYLARNKQYQSFWSLVSWMGCKDQLDRLWCTEPPEPSPASPSSGWTKYMDKAAYEPIMICDEHYGWDLDFVITSVGAYRRFNDSRGQRTLEWEKCQEMKAVKSSLHIPFDESVLLWHLATEFCYFEHVDTGSDATRHSRVMSNYMMYLLFVNPEMLVPGARRSLFTAAYRDLEPLGYVDEPKPMETVPGSPLKTRDDMARKIIQKVKSTIGSDDLVVHRAWELAHELMELARDAAEKKEKDLRQEKETKENADKWKLTGEQKAKAMELEKKMEKMKEKKLMIEAKKAGDDKMWAVIQGVWVEMLCFSAGRCRGYLHAKSLGKGGEYLSYVWLLLNYMGMETVPEKMQRPDLPVEGTWEQRQQGGRKDEAPNKMEQEENTKLAEASPAAATTASASAARTENAEQGGPEELITEMGNEPKGDTKQARETTSTQATTSAAVVTIIGDENPEMVMMSSRQHLFIETVQSMDSMDWVVWRTIEDGRYTRSKPDLIKELVDILATIRPGVSAKTESSYPLIITLKGAKTLADKLEMPDHEGDTQETTWEDQRKIYN